VIPTADDLVRFAEALRNRKLVSKETLAKMKMSRMYDPDGPSYGYGIYIRKFHGLTMLGHEMWIYLFSWKAKAAMPAKARYVN
jgi:CubicO group peptidase (beta-lactamase class C family)